MEGMKKTIGDRIAELDRIKRELILKKISGNITDSEESYLNEICVRINEICVICSMEIV